MSNPINGDNFATFVAARDFLQAHRIDYEAACRGFAWPRLETFNWALDYFDYIAAGNESPALWIVEEDGREEICSFSQMSTRSSSAANWLRAQGVRRGDRLLLMMGNERCPSSATGGRRDARLVPAASWRRWKNGCSSGRMSRSPRGRPPRRSTGPATRCQRRCSQNSPAPS